MSGFARGRSPGAEKVRALRRGAVRNSLQDLYLILLIFNADVSNDLREGRTITQETLAALRHNINR